MSKKDPKNYINNDELLVILKEYKDMCILAEKLGRPVPQQTNKMGLAFMKISENYAHNWSFRNYVFKDEMVQDGILACVKAAPSFDTDKSSNPFAFFTTCIYFSFLQKIASEKKSLYIKYKSMFNSIIDENAYSGDNKLMTDDVPFTKESQDVVNFFIREYEEKLQIKKEEKQLKAKESKLLNNIEE